MDRRRFLTLLGLAPLVPYVRKKEYSFLGGTLRPKAPELYGGGITISNFATMRIYITTLDGTRELRPGEYTVCHNAVSVDPMQLASCGRYVSVNYEVSGNWPSL